MSQKPNKSHEGLIICKHDIFELECFMFCREYANKAGYIVMPYWTGHGIGKYFHGPPHIFHVGKYLLFIMPPTLNTGFGFFSKYGCLCKLVHAKFVQGRVVKFLIRIPH